MSRCHYCNSLDTRYCRLCEAYFCDSCRKRYDKRIVSMVQEKLLRKGILWFSKDNMDGFKEKWWL